MRVLIDADGCPVVKICIEVCKKNYIEAIILCDTSHVFNYEGVQTIMVDKGADSVDFKLVNLIKAGDVVVTQDYGLAAMCLSRRAIVLNQNGMIYDNSNIDSLLLARHTAKKIRNSGGRLKGNSKRTNEQDEAFRKALVEIISK
jgi:uncharacterized protein YaiI (UPF0178 family)